MSTSSQNRVPRLKTADYGTYGKYTNYPPPPPPPKSYGSYSPYATYGTYRREAEPEPAPIPEADPEAAPVDYGKYPSKYFLPLKLESRD